MGVVGRGWQGRTWLAGGLGWGAGLDAISAVAEVATAEQVELILGGPLRQLARTPALAGSGMAG